MIVQIAAGVGLFFLGVLLGAFFHRSFQGETAKNKRLEQKISELEEQATRYQADVSAHFMETADLVKTMNKSYRDVHNHLAKSANKLCGSDQANDFLQVAFAGDELKRGKTIEPDAAELSHQPPMDYAPKSGDEEGTLSESYGLKEEENEEELAAAATPKEESKA